MDYRTLGRSGCSVSALCLGTMTFGAETDEAGAHEQLDLFLEAGGTLVDTADVYSAGMSEQIIGRWLSSRPSEVRDRVVLATKGRFPLTAEPNALGNSRRHLRRALDASLRRLGVEHIDLYQLHAWDPHTPLEETLRFLDDAVHAGKIGYPGLSTSPAGRCRRPWTWPNVSTSPSRSPCSPPTACSSAGSSSRSGLPASTTDSACSRGAPSAAAGCRGSTPGTSDRAAAPGWVMIPGVVWRPTTASVCASARGTCWRPCRTSPRDVAHRWHRWLWPGWSPGPGSPR